MNTLSFIRSSLILVLCSVASARAVQPQEQTADGYDDFARGTARSVTLSDLGVLVRLLLRSRRLYRSRSLLKPLCGDFAQGAALSYQWQW